MLVVSIVTVYLTNHFGMIRDPKLSFFPVLGIIWFGTSLTAVAFTTLKFKAAKALAGKIPPPDVLNRVLLQREVIKAVHEGIKKGVTSSTATKAKADGTAESASATNVVPFTAGKGEKEGGGLEDSDDFSKPSLIKKDETDMTFAERREKIEQARQYEEETKESNVYLDEGEFEDLDKGSGGAAAAADADDEDGPDASGQWMI